jgi:hypothetical protein
MIAAEMAFQLIVDDRVRDTTETLDEAVATAGQSLAKSDNAHVEIIDLTGGIYQHGKVLDMVAKLQNAKA